MEWRAIIREGCDSMASDLPGVSGARKEHQGERDSQWPALTSVASKLGCTAQTLRKWMRQEGGE